MLASLSHCHGFSGRDTFIDSGWSRTQEMRAGVLGGEWGRSEGAPLSAGPSQSLTLTYSGSLLAQRLGQLWRIWLLRGIREGSALETGWISSLDLEATLKPSVFLEGETLQRTGDPGGFLTVPALSPLELILQGLEASALQYQGPSGHLPGTSSQ